MLRDQPEAKSTHHSAAKIQKWFRQLPFRKQAIKMTNGHEADIQLAKVDLTERKAFVEEVKQCQFAKIAQRKNAATLALSALKANKINEIEASTVIELAPIVAVHGVDNTGFLNVLDEKGNITSDVCVVLKKILSNAAKHKKIPAKYLEEKEQDVFLQQYAQKLQSMPACAKLIYVINVPLVYDKFWYELSKLANLVEDEQIYSLSFGAIDLLGKEILKENWVNKKYRLGTLTREQIDDGQRFANTRPASVSAPEIKLPDEIELIRARQDDFNQHDEYHREQCSQIPKNMREALDRINLIARQQLGMYWTKEIWMLVDRDPSDLDQDLSKEKLFYKILSRVYHLFKVENSDHFNDEVKRIYPTLSGMNFVDKKLELRNKLKAAGHLVVNKNATSVFIWLVAMDMADHAALWQKNFALDVTSPDIQLDRHIRLYQKLKQQPGFNELDIKQKIFVLEKNYHREQKAAVPPASQLMFAKYPHKHIMKNNVCLVDSANPCMPEQNEHRALSANR